MSISTPVLGIICCTRQIGDEQGYAVMHRYVDAATRHADCDAVLLPAYPGFDPARVLARIDGVLLTGSLSNVDPKLYAGAHCSGPFDAARDALAVALVGEAARRDLPLFGICRGFQEIAIALGGSLDPDVGTRERLAHHAPPEAGFAAMFEHHHPVMLSDGGILATAFDEEQIEVNSVHFQGVDRLPTSIRIEARADDGLVEAFSSASGNAPLLAVQWHPEWDADTNPHSRTFFTLLGRALRGQPLPKVMS
jgi:putative glutamine amidotransferase